MLHITICENWCGGGCNFHGVVACLASLVDSNMPTGSHFSEIIIGEKVFPDAAKL
jgi:hypothetical protein